MAHCEHLFVNGGAAQTVVRLPENVCCIPHFGLTAECADFRFQVWRWSLRSCSKDLHPYQPVNSIESQEACTSRRADPTGRARSNPRLQFYRHSRLVRFDTPIRAYTRLVLTHVFCLSSFRRGELLLAISSSNQPVKPLTKSDLISLGKRGIVHPIVERGLFDFNDTQNSKLPPLKVDNDFTLLDTTLTACGDKASATAHLHIDVATHVEVNLEFGHTFVGSVIPPVLKDVGIPLALPP